MARREYMLRVRLNSDERRKLQYRAEIKDVSMSEIIQDYIKRLPPPPDDYEVSVRFPKKK